MRAHGRIRDALFGDGRRWRLPGDLVITPVRELPEEVLKQLAPDGQIPVDQYSVERNNARTLPKVINKNVADILQLFGHDGSAYGTVLASFAETRGLDRESVDGELKPLVATLIHSNLLIDGTAETDTAESIEPSLNPGDTWRDYRILENIKIMIDTEIHKVEHTATGDIGALKIAPPRFPTPEMKKSLVKRLTHEFDVLAKINHPYVVTLLETGTHQGRVYGILEYADGRSVRSFAYADMKRPDDAVLLSYSIQCVGALEAVHGSGFLHGDVHAGNFLIRDGRVCLIDFGLSRPIIIEKRNEKKYHQGGVIPYMPPEYVRHLDEDTRRLWGSVSTEIYSCAVVVYSLFTRKYPYEWTAYRKDYMEKILHDPPMSFEACERRPWPELEAVLRRALAKHPGDRYQSMSEFRDALERIAPTAAAGVDPFFGKTEPVMAEGGEERA